MKALVVSRRFQPGEGPSRGLWNPIVNPTGHYSTPPLHCTRAEPQVQYITKTMSGISIKLEFAVHKLPYIIKFKFCQTRISCWLQVLCNMITQIINHSQYLSVYFNFRWSFKSSRLWLYSASSQPPGVQHMSRCVPWNILISAWKRSIRRFGYYRFHI